jgi:hypothetical protein
VRNRKLLESRADWSGGALTSKAARDIKGSYCSHAIAQVETHGHASLDPAA